ncbi:hypothetical protein SFRURICE_016913 [Spodoptera frugiperda]|nr:hypothetical protein SFRURICE_016913 [Spodoptera frugiperda]
MFAWQQVRRGHQVGPRELVQRHTEVVARHIAEKYQYDVVLDAFCVVAIDIDANKIAMAKHNATIYGVHEKIEFITGDFFELAPRLKADMAKEYDDESMLRSRPASELMQVARTISPNYVGGSVYKASGAPVDAFLCRTLKGEDHLRNVTMIFPLTYPTVRNTEPRRRRCECGCEDYEYQQPTSINIDNILRGEISTQFDPPPPYPGPGPSNDAPPPPYWTLYGPQMPYYEPPPPYIETVPAPRPQPVPVHVTPEVVAWKYQCNVFLDAFCGAGGNTIQFARTCNRVVAIDIEPNKIAMTKHNATIYGVHEKIEFITGDFFELAPRLKAGMVFLTPPWGGPSYSKAKEYEVESMLRPRPASELMQVARTISPNVELFLPRNTRHDQFTPGLWASSTQEEFSLMSSLGRRVRGLSQYLVHQRALPLVESRDTRGKAWELLFIYVGGSVYKASGAPVDTFLCRPLKGEDLLQGCEDYHYEYQEPESMNIDNILRGETSSQYDPPPPYPGPGPSNDAPPPPYWTLYGPQMPYYEPPPPYIETTPAPRPQPVPVQYEASRPCKLGRNLRKDLFYINVMVPITMPANFSVRPQIGGTVYKASGAPFVAFLCRTPKGEDL